MIKERAQRIRSLSFPPVLSQLSEVVVVTIWAEP